MLPERALKPTRHKANTSCNLLLSRIRPCRVGTFPVTARVTSKAFPIYYVISTEGRNLPTCKHQKISRFTPLASPEPARHSPEAKPMADGREQWRAGRNDSIDTFFKKRSTRLAFDVTQGGSALPAQRHRGIAAPCTLTPAPAFLLDPFSYELRIRLVSVYKSF